MKKISKCQRNSSSIHTLIHYVQASFLDAFDNNYNLTSTSNQTLNFDHNQAILDYICLYFIHFLGTKIQETMSSAINFENVTSIHGCMENMRNFLNQMKKLYGPRDLDEAKPFINHLKKR